MGELVKHKDFKLTQYPLATYLELSFPAILSESGNYEDKVMTRNVQSALKPKPVGAFDAQSFLDSAGLSRKLVEYRKSEKIYSQGELAKSVLYIQKGGIKLSVVNQVGKEAVVAILGAGDFFGEGCLAGQQDPHGDGDHGHAYDLTRY